MIRKILQRGPNPPLHAESETMLLKLCGLEEELAPSASQEELSPRLKREFDVGSFEALMGWTASELVLDEELRYGSTAELDFLRNWASQNLGSESLRWFIPQAPLDTLLSGLGHNSSAWRRVDFLVFRPPSVLFAVEIDGAQHEDRQGVDEERDSALAKAGVEVVRIPTQDLAAGAGQGLARVRELFEVSDVSAPLVDNLKLAFGPAQTHRLMLALLEAVSGGFVAGDRWVIQLSDPLETAVHLIRPYLNLMVAVDQLWGPVLAPDAIHIKAGDKWHSFAKTDTTYEPTSQVELPPDVVVRLESDRFPIEELVPLSDDIPEVVVRSSLLPVDIFDPVGDTTERIQPRTTSSETPSALATVLQMVFAKRSFRDGQLEAITEVLEGRDCAVLLPTGAGKSLIYQLAGLCLPGRTLVIDPIIALMEDQIEGLAAHGIERAAGISSHEVQRGRADEILQRIASGDALFIFISPERLQQQSFRSTLRELASTTPINLAVIDESHCVSEWGHDFRTSYLSLGKVIRETCRDGVGAAPPLLALTGTASRSVLRDVLLELAIESRSPNSVIKPPSFDRPELRFHIVHSKPEESFASLSGYLRSLPSKFNVPHAEFFRSKRAGTQSGIIFCPHVNGEFGVEHVAEGLQSVVGTRPPVFSGQAPRGYGGDWESDKRRATAAFKANETPLLVSTKAFGMGIDKPNIRYVVHYGIPTSIEAYYQEVGRAGRDGQVSNCGLILTEFDERRARQLLDEDVDLEATRATHDGIDRSSADDISRALYFHLNSFRGVESELIVLEDLIEEIGRLDVPHSESLPMGDGQDARASRERGLHRLVLLGLLIDYTIDWGGGSFDARVDAITTESVVEKLLSFVERSQPGRTQAIEATLRVSEWEKPRDAVLACGEILIGFIYDTIERSRRRSLREMWLSARESSTGEDLRARILDYLSEGDLTPVLEELAEKDAFVFSNWVPGLESILSSQDAREWRGATARLLASYPDHPGLLLGRALSELIDSDGDLEEFASNLQQAVASAFRRYGVQPEAVKEYLEWFLGKAELRGAVSAVLASFQDAGLPTLEWEALERKYLDATRPDAGVAIISLARRLTDISEDLKNVAENLNWRYP